MARPRVFVSSTFYDLKQVRADPENFIKNLGYEPVLNERGHVPYGNEERLEQYCYKKINLSDIIVAIVGGRYGSASQHEPYSISQMELRTAVELGKPLFVFVEQQVFAEFRTYQQNRENENVVYASVDDRRVYEFLDEIEKLPKNNPIYTFNSVNDMTVYLKEQWAGLFQRYLQDQSRLNEVSLVRDMKATTDTLNRLVHYLSKEKKGSDETVKSILTQNHPIFPKIADLTSTPYRVFFTNYDEMKKWLEARRYQKRESDNIFDENEEWVMQLKGEKLVLNINRERIFEDEGRLRIVTPDSWEDEWLSVSREEEFADLDDEIPF